jgi:hypothetical protein
MKSVVADSGPLISFVRIKRLDLIEAICNKVLISRAVATEIAPPGKRKRGASTFHTASWITIQEVSPESLTLVSTGLGSGEREAIALAYEKGQRLLIDEIDGRKEADRLGVLILPRTSL